MRLPPSRSSCKNCWSKYSIYRFGRNFDSRTTVKNDQVVENDRVVESDQNSVKTTASAYETTKCGQTMILFQTDANRNIITVSHIVWVILLVQNMAHKIWALVTYLFSGLYFWVFLHFWIEFGTKGSKSIFTILNAVFMQLM